MSPGTDFFVAETRRVLALPAGAPLDFSPIEKGGSDRTFHRVLVDGRSTAILMHYGEEREENRLFVPIGRYLEGIGVPVPRILATEASLRLVWLEDLGSVDLHALADRPWEERGPIYARVLDGIARLHRRDPSEPAAGGVVLSPAFDGRLYHWEHEYFLENFVGRICGMGVASARSRVMSEFSLIADAMLDAPATLIHRDFQSQNIMVRDSGVAFVDFQGMRVGTAYYDLASLLFDPYVPMGAEARDEMLRLYRELVPGAAGSWEAFHRLVQIAGCQRLMQALGAYGFLGLAKGRRAFLAHVPRGLARLGEAVGGAGGFPSLEALVEECGEAIAKRPI